MISSVADGSVTDHLSSLVARGLTDGGDFRPEQVKWDVDLEPNLPRHGSLRTATAQIHRFLVEGTVTLQTLSFRGNVVPTESPWKGPKRGQTAPNPNEQKITAVNSQPAQKANLRRKTPKTRTRWVNRRNTFQTQAGSTSPSKNVLNPNEMGEPPNHVPNPSGKHISTEKRQTT